MDLPASRRVVLGALAATGRMPVEILEPAGPPAGLALVAHGRNGAPDQAHMCQMIRACLECGLRVVAPHLSNSAAGDGAVGSGAFTIAGHVAEVRHLVAWARASAPPAGEVPGIVLAGHSMGAYAALRIAAEAAPGEIAGVVAVAPVVSGRALLAARQRMGAAAIEALLAELPAAFAEWPGHDLMPLAPRIAAPVALITGAADGLTPPADAAALGARLPRLVLLATLPGQHHCPVGSGFDAALGRALDLVGRAARAR